MISIFYALKNEITELKKRVDNLKHYQIENIKLHEGLINNKEVLLVQTGIGTKNSAKVSEKIFEKKKIDLIISTGFAGGIREGINVGDIVCSNNILKDNNSNIIEIDTNILKKVLNKNKFNIHFGDTVTVEEVVKSSNDKFNLGKKFNAIAVEMEAFSIAENAKKHNIPFISIRAISDDVFFDLDLDKISEIKEDGSIDIKKTGIKILKNINYVPHIIKLRKQTVIASNNLSDFIFRFISDNNIKN